MIKMSSPSSSVLLPFTGGGMTTVGLIMGGYPMRVVIGAAVLAIGVGAVLVVKSKLVKK